MKVVCFQEAFFGSDILFKSREAPKETLKSLDSDEERVAPGTAKLFTDTTVKDESSIQISSQIRKELADMPKPSSLGISSEKEADMKEPIDNVTGMNVSPEPADFQLPEDVGDFDIDDNFIKMIESELEGGSHLDNDIESGKIREFNYIFFYCLEISLLLYMCVGCLCARAPFVCVVKKIIQHFICINKEG